MKFWVVIPAAGQGTRFDADRPKQFHLLAGKSVLAQTLSRFIDHPQLAGIQVVLPDDCPPPADIPEDPRIQYSVGGATRASSVLSGLTDLLMRPDSDVDDWVLVHDAARPLLPAEDLEALLQALNNGPAYLAAPVAETLRTHNGETLDRDAIWRVLTPQGATLSMLTEAISQTDENLTDDIAYLQAAGHPCQAIAADPINQKVTWPRDLRLANAVWGELD